MNMKKRMLSIVLSGAMAVSTAVSAGSFSAFAVAQCVAYSGSNVNAQDYVQWSDTVKSYLTVCDNGNYMRVQSGAIEGKLLVEYYSPILNRSALSLSTMNCRSLVLSMTPAIIIMSLAVRKIRNKTTPSRFSVSRSMIRIGTK